MKFRPFRPSARWCALLVVSGVLLSALSEGADPVVIPDDLNIERDQVYKTVDGVDLTYDLILPEKNLSAGEKAPFILHIHGGGWRGGNKEMIYHPRFLAMVRPLLEESVIFASIEYRRARVGGATTVESLADCKDAVQFFIDHAAEFGIDPGRIGLFGGSAGGHLTLMTALTPAAQYPVTLAKGKPEPEIAAAVAYYPLAHFGQPDIMESASYGTPGRFDAMLGGSFAEKRELAEKLSPINWLEDGNAVPPILVLHGDADTVLPVRSPRLFVERARSLNLPVTYIEAAGGNHGFSTPCVPALEEMTEEVVAFFREHLKIATN